MKENIEDIDNLATVIIAMQVYGNQRFNAALSEAIEKVALLPFGKYEYEVFEILEGLKIKP